MEANFYMAIGLMSGTSLDGIDLIYVKIDAENDYHFEILKFESIDYCEKWKNKLTEAFGYSAESLAQLDVEYGQFLGQKVLEFCTRNSIEKVDFLASHGHTIFHNPEQGYTTQIGAGSALAAKTGMKVVCDFRSADVALGGQGAPLVPMGDRLLFSDYDFCLNLGGFANVSYEMEGERIAFDIAPANIGLNYFSRKEGLEFDPGGRLASTGVLDSTLLEALNNLTYYHTKPPKSLGYEFVEEEVIPLVESKEATLADRLHTLIEHCAIQVAKSLRSSGLPLQEKKMLVTGGGAFNDFLMQRIAALTEVEVVKGSPLLIEAKEALVFALLGALRIDGKINCLKSVTGAVKDHSSGQIYDL